MRPLNIYVSAFGPYAGKVNIDIGKLGDRGLYLITGDTGAGKTTIFDAICYALYGASSGGNREGSMLRSLYADPSTPTEVELTFVHNDKKYTVKRNPEYMKPKDRGEGFTKRTADAELTLPDGRVITKIKDVDTEIEKILGINKDQFSQIVMLAQGDFLKLLLAETKDRIKIFRDIFKTEYYQMLQNELEQRRKDIFVRVEDGLKSVKQYIDGIMADKDDVLSIEADKAKAGNMTTEDVISLLDRLTDKDMALKDDLDAELSKINEELEKVNTRLGAARALENAKAALKKALEELAGAEPVLKESEEELKAATEAYKGKADLDKQANGIEKDLESYDRLDKLAGELDDTVKEAYGTETEIAGKTADKGEKEKELKNLKEEQSSLKDSGEADARLESDIDNTQKDIVSLNDLSQKLEKYDEDLEALDISIKKYKEDDEEFNKLNSKYETMEQAFMDAQAGILAEKLKEGEACPVCGSKTHPKLARISDVVPTERELKDAKDKASKARKVREDSSIEVEGLRKGLASLEESLKKETKKALKIDDIDKAPEMITQIVKELNESLKELKQKKKTAEANKRRRTELEKVIPECENELAGMTQKISELTALKASLDAQIKEKTAQIETIGKDLKFADKAKAKAAISDLKKRSDELQKRFDKAGLAVSFDKQRIAELKATIATQQKTISASGAEDPDKILKLQSDLKIKHDECVDRGQSVGTRIKTNESIRTNIIKKSGDISELEEKLKWVSALANTANGKLTGKDRIMLETYIQTMYFDRIINRANLRLLTMSGGQYELVRKKEQGKGSAQSGLDLNVIDHNNGSERSVKTLSGGESFMASLSLALGLSDEVQSSAGGIHVDTMFVDEGFGSLDPDSLDMAYKALAGLTTSNRLVGIISHVADLKSRIDKQIVVTKDKTGGSRVDLIV